MKAIVLAAGSGRRLRPWTDVLPKYLLPIGAGLTILEHQVRNFLACGIRTIVVVAGYRAAAIREALQGACGDDPAWRLLYNPRFDDFNQLYTLWVAADELDGPCLIVNSDLVFDYRILQLLLAAGGQDLILALGRHDGYDADAMKVRLRGGLIDGITKLMPPGAAHAESIGMIR